MTHGEIEDVDVKSAGQFIKDMTGIGVIVPDDALEDYVREIGHLPERTVDSRKEDPVRTNQQNQNQPPEDEDPETEEEIDDDQDKRMRRLRSGGLGGGDKECISSKTKAFGENKEAKQREFAIA